MNGKLFAPKFPMPDPFFWFLFAIAILGMLLFYTSIVRTEEVDASLCYPKDLWKGLIAEATSDGYRGMYAVACCVRNRLNKGMSAGLVGLKRKDLDSFVKKEGVRREKEAKDIVRQVFEENTQDVTGGAIYFECIERYGKPSFIRNTIRTTKIGEHTFFKDKK